MGTQQLGWQAQSDEMNIWYQNVKNDIVKLQSYDFDNIAALSEVTLTTVFNSNNVTETIRSSLTSVKIAERITTFNSDGSINEKIRVYSKTGAAVMKEAEMTSAFNGNIVTATSKGYCDYTMGGSFDIPALNAHLTDKLAHQNIILDGNKEV